MSFKIGDYVRFINERQEGVVTNLIDHQLIGVTIDGDFEITVLASEVVLVHTEENQISEVVQQEKIRVINESNKNQTIYLAIQRDVNISHLYHQYLINQTSYELTFQFYTEKNNTYQGISSDIIEAFNYKKIASFPLSDLDFHPVYHFQFLFFKIGDFQPKQPVIYKKQLKGKSIIMSEKDIPILGGKGHLIELEESLNSPIHTEFLQENLMNNKSSFKSEVEKPNSEIDLHIEELTEEFPTMTANEMLQFQLAVFNKNLEQAISHQFSTIIFIHGVGNGTLRNEIHRQLGKHPNIRTFKDARKEKFGYGATEVFIK